MAAIQLLGLFHEAEPTADTIEHLRNLGMTDEQITVMSAMPYSAEMLGRPRVKTWLPQVALAGAVLGAVTAGFLTVGIFILYPLGQGGQPIIPIPPSLIVFFEVIMLGTMWATFFGLLLRNGFPDMREGPYDPRITEGHVGVLAEVDESLADQVQRILEDNGAHHMQRVPARHEVNRGFTFFWGTVVAGVALLGLVVLLLAYEVVKIPLPNQMVEQDSIAYEQGPRLAAPEAAVPIQGPVLIAGQPASQPLPATADSLQRGQVLFGINCVVCHGPSGNGQGTLSGYFTPKPADLTSATVQDLSDADIFMVLTNGWGVMPSLAENLTATERWDVVNYVRSLSQ
jgi:mono/diheme cytochrome c family protein